MARSLINEDVRRGIRQLRELEDRFLNGSIDPRMVRARLQDLIEGSFNSGTVPSWYVSPELQVVLVKSILRNIVPDGWQIPPQPEFRQTTETEVLMLCVYLQGYQEPPAYRIRRTINALYSKISFAHLSVRLDRLPILDPDALRLSQREKSYRPGIRWVAVDLEANRGASVAGYRVATESAGKADMPRLADVEIVMAMFLFPGWVALWDEVNEGPRESVPRPALGNLSYDFYDGDLGVPVFGIDAHDDKEDVLGLHTWVDHMHSMSVCLPTVRELS